MIPRRALTCIRVAKPRSLRVSSFRSIKPSRRCSSSSSTPQPPPLAAASPISPLASIANELDKLAPRFDVSADKVEIVRSPAEFYETLKAKIAKAKRRVYLSTLYVGKSEHELVSHFHPDRYVRLMDID